MKFKEIKNIKDGWINYVKSKIPQSLPKEIRHLAEERIDICKSCMHLKQKSRTQYMCCLCGCAFPAMVYAPNKTCPDDKW